MPTTSDRPLPELTLPGPYTDAWHRIAEVAALRGDAPAIEGADGRLSYAELEYRVRALVAELTPLLGDDAPGERRPVAVLAEQSADSLAALVAVLATGSPCVLLDVVLPEERIGVIAELAGAEVVLSDDAHRDLAGRLPGVKTVRGLLPADGAPAPALDRAAAELGDPASIMFTSGTTGVPKGVVYTQRTVLATGVTCGETLRLVPEDRVSLVLPASFAAGQILVFGALLNGATLCVRDPRVRGLRDLVDWLATTRVTTLHCTPSLLRSIGEALPEGAVLDSVRMVTTAGEKVYGADVAAFRPRLRPDASFVNWLGSSETAELTAFEIGPDDPVPDGVVPAGRPVPLRELIVLDPEGARLPQGEVGVLHVESAYMSAGYWNAPETTAAVFTPLPDGRTRFRTGDRARFAEDGVLHLVGRADDAVKIRGYLVEPAEVEAVLRSLPDVVDAVVRARADGDEPARLVAWVVPEPALRTPSPAALRSAVARVLPDYMVPRDVVLLADLPRSERGKVDVRGLPDPAPRPAPTPPATDAERAVEQLWAPVLKLEAVGRDESFTALGGDSLAVEEMLARLQAELDVSLASGDLAEHPTLAEFAVLVDAARRGRRNDRVPDVVRLRTTGSRTPVFCLAGAGGEAAYFEALAGALGPDQPVYALQAHGYDARGVPDWTVRRAARRYLTVVERLVPEGPVQLVGHSMGGLVAMALAHLLSARGRRVELLTLLDTYLPHALVGDARQPGEAAGDGPGAVPSRGDLWRVRARVLGAGLRYYEPEVRKQVFFEQGARVVRYHRPTPWPGRALVVLSNENVDDVHWWDRLLTGEREVVRLDCDHNALLKVPYVTTVAEHVAAATPAS
jgi:amino acid adenylation domain-containing protein